MSQSAMPGKSLSSSKVQDDKKKLSLVPFYWDKVFNDTNHDYGKFINHALVPDGEYQVYDRMAKCGILYNDTRGTVFGLDGKIYKVNPSPRQVEHERLQKKHQEELLALHQRQLDETQAVLNLSDVRTYEAM